MSTVNEYHNYARDCQRGAATARTEEQRQRFLSLADDWTHAALGLEGVPVRSEPDNVGSGTPQRVAPLGGVPFVNTRLSISS